MSLNEVHITNFRDLLQSSKQNFGDYLAIVTEDTQLTYREFIQQIEERAASFSKRKIVSNQLVLIEAEKDINTLINICSLMLLGAVAVPYNPKFTSTQRSVLLGNNIFNHHIQAQSVYPLSEKAHVLNASDSSQICNGIYTSGSTGTPKLAIHSLTNHIASATGSHSLIPIASSSRLLMSLPLFHIGGLALVFRALLSGASLWFHDKADDAEYLATNQITHISLVATQLRRLMERLKEKKYPLHIHAALVGGGPIPTELVNEAVQKGIPCYTTYGMTEMSSQIATNDLNNSIYVLPYRELKTSPDNEILVKGKVLFQGYLHNNKLELPTDEEGWFHTKDLGEFNNGTLKILGRLDNQFISGGENIQPESIETILLQQTSVKACCVVPVNDTQYGQRPFAFILSEQPMETVINDIKIFLEKNLPSYMRPIGYAPMPTSSDLKISRQELIKKAEQIHTGTAQDSL
ncbi:o-succinylbenzoate--CoA ligase [Teredinibacter sp. KSP-S5-2]|uniref:o-succinylbenzoate--CoA ligase n=1 Tax=Teredinibacter sp. KSP-S5-2 TaxID=3034506 RepID=UPI002934CB69|nr:o-succinylbenzoate--CoA ligase [Teredinibacter sp. KSP-S5-2]WNO09380.1 o-succinylbenzoate--CoA ligase [Teredinibacter sp. KSP-S5-2]